MMGRKKAFEPYFITIRDVCKHLLTYELTQKCLQIRRKRFFHELLRKRNRRETNQVARVFMNEAVVGVAGRKFKTWNTFNGHASSIGTVRKVVTKYYKEREALNSLT